MSAHLHSPSLSFDGTPARELLEEIAHLHRLVLVTDEAGRVQWISQAWQALCGADGEVVGRDLREGLAKLPRPEQSFALRAEMRERGWLDRSRVQVRGPDDTPIDMEFSIFPVQLDGVAEPYRVVVARPVAEERAEPGPSGTHDAVSTGVSGETHEAVVAVDEHGFITDANAAAEGLLGRPPEQLRGRPITLLAGAQSDLERLLAALRSGERRDIDLTLRRPEGGTTPVSATVSSHRPLGNGECSSVIFLREAAARREVEAELTRKYDELERCVNTLAHDLRSPLVALLGFSRLLRQDYGERLDDSGRHYVERIEQAGRTMESLIHDLLELSRIGQPGERRAMIDPRAVLLQLSAELKTRLDAEGIELVLPPDPPLVYCDRTRLYQVFSNLIGNAIQYMGECCNPRIAVEVVENDDHHQISVADSGRGIAPDHHERIFEAFHSIGDRRDGTRGTGMGLAIVRKIAETHSGLAWVESTPGEGARFHVTLPRR